MILCNTLFHYIWKELFCRETSTSEVGRLTLQASGTSLFVLSPFYRFPCIPLFSACIFKLILLYVLSCPPWISSFLRLRSATKVRIMIIYNKLFCNWTNRRKLSCAARPPLVPVHLVSSIVVSWRRPRSPTAAGPEHVDCSCPLLPWSTAPSGRRPDGQNCPSMHTGLIPFPERGTQQK